MNTSFFNVKLVVFGEYFEVYKYSKPVLTNYFRQPKKPKINMDKTTKRFAFSINRTRNTVRRLVASNFTNQSSFLTLTFADNVQDISFANSCFKQFVRYIRNYIRTQGEYPVERFKYLAVIEFQKRGAIHYHIIMEAPFISFDILNAAWPYGWFKINQTKHIENIGAYVSKYLYKDVDDVRLRGKRAYQTSRNLSRPLEITDKNTIRQFLSNVKGVKKFIKKSTFDNEFTGRVYYRQYKRTRKIG